MKYYQLKPEVPGEFINPTTLDRSTHPPKVEKLRVRLDGWAGGHLLEIFPCFFVTKQLMAFLKEQRLTGCRFQRLRYRFGEHAQAPMRAVKFWQLTVEEQVVGTDFYRDKSGYLMASERAMACLRSSWLENCDVTSDEARPCDVALALRASYASLY